MLSFPLLFAFSLFNDARVQVFAATRASSKIGRNMVPAETVVGALRVNCKTRSRVPLMPHNETLRTPWRP